MATKLVNGKVRRLADVRSQDEDKVRGYAATEYFDEVHFVAISVTFYEGGTYHLMDLRSGAETDVEGVPVLSPDRRRFVVHQLDQGSGYTPSVLSIYRITSTGLALEFREKPARWGPMEVMWKNDATVTFNEFRLEDQSSERKVRELVYTGGTWKLR